MESLYVLLLCFDLWCWLYLYDGKLSSFKVVGPTLQLPSLAPIRLKIPNYDDKDNGDDDDDSNVKDKDNDDDDDKAVWVGDGADTESLEPPQCYNYLQSDTGGVNITFKLHQVTPAVSILPSYYTKVTLALSILHLISHF